MRAAILAGGKGTRIGMLYPDLPKPMIPVAGKPLLQYQLELLVKHGIVDITLIAGHKADVISSYFGDGHALGAQIKYIIEESPLGTGGALSMLPKDDTLELLGDVFLDVDLHRFIMFHQEHHAAVSIFAHPNTHPYDSDIISVSEDSDLVLKWHSKSVERTKDLRNLVNAGMYIFSRDALPKGGMIRCDLDKEIIMPMIPQGIVYAYRSTEYIKDMGTPERLEAVSKDIAKGIPPICNLNRKQRAIFIDRDGTLNEEAGYIRSPEQLRLILGAGEAIRQLNSSPFLAICITNQPVIARGDVTPDGLDEIHARLDVLLGQHGAYLDDLFYCPHHPDKGFAGEVPEYKIDCTCRKPKHGLLLEAAQRYNIDLHRSYMVGDRLADIAAGNAAGCTTIGVLTGAALSDGQIGVVPDAVCTNVLDAVNMIMAEDTE